jgi:hypothetical protein
MGIHGAICRNTIFSPLIKDYLTEGWQLSKRQRGRLEDINAFGYHECRSTNDLRPVRSGDVVFHRHQLKLQSRFLQLQDLLAIFEHD